MAFALDASQMLSHEAEALLSRLARVKPFSLTETMVPAAAVSPAALDAIERQLARERGEMKALVRSYLRWLHAPEGRQASPSEAQKRFTLLRLKFNAMLSQVDIFADVLSQRSEHGYGVWIAGLDAIATDALSLPGGYYRAAPVICFVDRGVSAAIRRARTRLPGGDSNPVAVIRIPRERMIGSGIASSLVHEVGHAGSALLGLGASLRPVLETRLLAAGPHRLAWSMYNRWISEILADFWSVARVGVTSTLGLMGVVSLPRTFVLRYTLNDAHPAPWTRVRISCAIGNALYPHPQWNFLSQLWKSFYPLEGLDAGKRKMIASLETILPDFIELLVEHRPKALRGKTLSQAVSGEDRRPDRLGAAFREWLNSPSELRRAQPCLAFAAIGQAKMDGRLSPQAEDRLIGNLLEHWALRGRRQDAGFPDAHSLKPAQHGLNIYNH